MQLSREMRWAATGRIVPQSAAFDGSLTPTPRRRSLVRGNDISEEPMTQRWKGGKGRRLRAEKRCRLGLCFHQGTPGEHTSQ
jgi:hypothetical protein